MRIFGVVISVMLMTLTNNAAAYDADRLPDPDVQDNFVGTEWHLGFEATLRPGRIVIETDPKRIRSGDNSIRLHLEPGDCGRYLRPDGKTIISSGGNDCDDYKKKAGSERVGIQPKGRPKGVTYYGVSFMLDENMALHQTPDWGTSDINLFQWMATGPSGAILPCFNIMYRVAVKRLVIEDRCRERGLKHNYYSFTNLHGKLFDVWHDFVVAANWSTNPDKGFIRILYNGKLVLDLKGQTLAPRANTAVEAAFIYRYNGLEGWYPEPSTVWFDDLIRTGNIGVVKERYDFDETLLLTDQ